MNVYFPFQAFFTPCFQCPSQVSARRISRREPRTYMFSGVASITDRLPYTFLLHGSEWYSTVCCTIPYNKKYNFVVYMLIRGQKDLCLVNGCLWICLTHATDHMNTVWKEPQPFQHYECKNRCHDYTSGYQSELILCTTIGILILLELQEAINQPI